MKLRKPAVLSKGAQFQHKRMRQMCVNFQHGE
jgi:hypothetical protein